MKFCGLRHSTEFNERLSSRFFRREPGAQVVCDVQGQMAFQLFGKFALALLAIEDRLRPYS